MLKNHKLCALAIFWTTYRYRLGSPFQLLGSQHFREVTDLSTQDIDGVCAFTREDDVMNEALL